MEEQKVSKRKKGTVKKVVLSLLGVVLIVGVTIIGTLAFLSTITETKTNTFTASKDIVLGLEEPGWNLDDNGDVIDDDETNPGNFQPGTIYTKDPVLANLTGEVDGELAEEWVAMRVDYSITPSGSSSATKVTYENITTDDTSKGYTTGKAGLIKTIDFNSNWYQIPTDVIASITKSEQKYDIFIYKYKLKAEENMTSMDNLSSMKLSDGTYEGAKTSNLFGSIEIKSQTKLIANGWKDSSNKLELPTNFQIEVKGAAIKHDAGISATSINTSDITTSKTTTDSYKIAKELVELLK